MNIRLTREECEVIVKVGNGKPLEQREIKVIQKTAKDLQWELDRDGKHPKTFIK